MIIIIPSAGKNLLWGLFDVSAAFDSIDYTLLLKRLSLSLASLALRYPG